MRTGVRAFSWEGGPLPRDADTEEGPAAPVPPRVRRGLAGSSTRGHPGSPTMPLGCSQGPATSRERTQQVGRKQGHSPTSWHQLNSTGPSAEHSPAPWSAPIPQRQPVRPCPLVGACLPPPLPQTATPWILPSAAEYPPRPTPPHLPLRNFARMGHSSSSLGERPKSGEPGGLGCSVPKAARGF